MKVKNYKSKRLNEDTLEQAVKDAERKLSAGNNEVETVENGTKTEIEEVLDLALANAETEKELGGNAYLNVLLVGDAGFGKTAITQQWARDNNVNLVIYKTSTAEEADLTGVTAKDKTGEKTIKLPTDVLRALNAPRSVLFLDEYNRGKDRVRGALLTLIKDHMIDAGTYEKSNVQGISGQIELEGMLFTVAAINPADENYNTAELDDAEVSRFMSLEITPNKMDNLRYLEKTYTSKINKLPEGDPRRAQFEGMLSLARKLLTDNAFRFDGPKDVAEGKRKFGKQFKPLNYRSLEMALQASQGKKDQFIKMWRMFANPMKLSTIETILSDYTDVDDKANSPFKNKRQKSAEEKLDDYLDL